MYHFKTNLITFSYERVRRVERVKVRGIKTIVGGKLSLVEDGLYLIAFKQEYANVYDYVFCSNRKSDSLN